ncbi:maleylpyruvate isomerase family mycothiol-dependent enzyme [Microtetraspora sp. AC03309]|uniref:maleylpyruvate isomerase family mycothiol-dependent enzyme n=1 Tax=Microtetraspora sp. AC03309 TaxID=2779376 RepID=UPI001E5D25B4|nr:maleylpyruvate isomerase family mycothiol-dependent enzyme [Microtetraspora sp. AC03309]MCC5574680.1 maleylpyruvate isomerase family mycothiol-dependent enzyme [Microtetraspora sp. AC03309]
MTDSELLKDLDPFDIFDAEAARLDRFFSSLDDEGWRRPSRCAGWSVRDVLGHLAGEELYNHACLDGDLDGLFAMLEREGVGGGYNSFNDWCVRQRRDRPVGDVLEEWRGQNAETRARMRALGRDATLTTSAGPYPVDLQTFHYGSEYATHGDDVGAPVSAEEAGARTLWRVRFGLFTLREQGAAVRAEPSDDHVEVRVDGATARLPYAEFVEATVGRLPADHPLDTEIAMALRCLA